MARRKKEENLHRKNRPKKHRKNAVLAVVLVLVLVAALALAGAVVVGKTSVIHPNMVLNGVEVGGMTVDKAEKALSDSGWEAQGDSEVSVTLPGDFKITVNSEEAGLKLTSREAAEAAYAYGHSGNLINDLKAYFKCITGKVGAADVLATANAEGVRAKVDAALKEYDEFLKQGYRVDTENAKLELIKGGESVRVDADELCSLIVKAFDDKTYTVDYTAKVDDAESVDFNKIHDEIYAEMVEPKYDAETKKATESTVGVDFDVEQAQKLWNDAAPGDTVTVPLTVTKPKHSSEELNKMLFRDKLGAQTTVYRSSAAGRATNVELSAAKINGVVLNPGEVFDYNAVVGKRTAEAGFKVAGAYAGGKVVQEVGGGICQVSSTIYCAAMLAQMTTVERTCHMFVVNYLPYGLDATVSWPGPDYKFRNDRDYPVKIVAYCNDSDNSITVEIWGTDVDGSYVELTSGYGYRYDSTYPDVVIGYSAVSYRNIYDKDGNLIDRVFEASSSYDLHENEIKWPDSSESPSPSDSGSTDPSTEPSTEPPKPTEPSPDPTIIIVEGDGNG